MFQQLTLLKMLLALFQKIMLKNVNSVKNGNQKELIIAVVVGNVFFEWIITVLGFVTVLDIEIIKHFFYSVFTLG